MSYDKLTIDSDIDAGSFVRNLRGVTGTGFAEGSHVHKDWWSKTLTYEQVKEQAQVAVDNREDILTETKNISCVVDNDEFRFRVGGRTFRPTDHCIEQFSVRTGVTSSSFLREMRNIEGFDSNDAETMVAVGNNALRRIEADKKFRIRTYTDGTARAFVTEQYAPVDNRWYLETVAEFIPGGRFSHWRGDEDTIYGNILIPDTIMDYGQDDDTDYGGMISVGNCEVGTRRISQMPSLFRAICLNGCIWGQTKGEQIRRVHRGNIDLTKLKFEIADNIQQQIPLLAPGIRKFLETRGMEIGKASTKGVIAAVSSDNKLTKREATEFLEQYITYETHESNLFGVIAGLTRAGQKFDNKTWVRMDEIAGSLMEMSADRWSTLLRRADTFNNKDYEKVFALTA